MRTAILSLVIGAVLAFQPLVGEAQEYPISFDVRGGYSIPFGDFGDATDSDFGFGVGAVFNVTPSIGIYGGYARDGFDCALCSDDNHLHASGLEAGLKFIVPRGGNVVPWLKAGVIAQKVSFDTGIVEFESDRKYGFQAAAGLDFPLGEVISISPGFRVNFLDLDEPDDDDFLESPEVRYFSIDIGAHIHIPRN